jgi:F-type H+-transporting ATPase subunit a
LFFLNITRLFNLFSPITINRVSFSVIRILFVTIIFIIRALKINIFLRAEFKSLLLVRAFLALAFINLVSLVCYRFPLTTVIRVNLGLALFFWGATILLVLVKLSFVSRVLPSHTPRYLIPFLRVVELVRLGVRPITLGFRLLANISAGHILLTLVCKLRIGL